jgi:hypothetical protein
MATQFIFEGRLNLNVQEEEILYSYRSIMEKEEFYLHNESRKK